PDHDAKARARENPLARVLAVVTALDLETEEIRDTLANRPFARVHDAGPAEHRRDVDRARSSSARSVLGALPRDEGLERRRLDATARPLPGRHEPHAEALGDRVGEELASRLPGEVSKALGVGLAHQGKKIDVTAHDRRRIDAQPIADRLTKLGRAGILSRLPTPPDLDLPGRHPASSLSSLHRRSHAEIMRPPS